MIDKNLQALAAQAVELSKVELGATDAAAIIDAVVTTIRMHQNDTWCGVTRLTQQVEELNKNLAYVINVAQMGVPHFAGSKEAEAFFGQYFPTMTITWTYSDRKSAWEGRGGSHNLLIAYANVYNPAAREE